MLAHVIMTAGDSATVEAHGASSPPGSTGSTANRLRFTVARMARLLRQQDDSGFGPTVTAALATIDKHGPMTLGELAAHEQVAPPSITKVVEKLVARDLVTRETDPNDRRSSLVRVTKQGRRHLDTSRTKRTEWLAGRLASLDADERARLDAAMDVLEKIIAVPDRGQR
jgi:DNA-binding MarR family transcriptional regulator